MTKITTSPEAAYLTSPNIVHPLSQFGTQADTKIAADEVAARADIAARAGIAVTGGTIKKGK